MSAFYDELKPGPETDARVAEQFMGWTVERDPLDLGPHIERHGPTGVRAVPPYSSDIAAAWPLLERMIERRPGQTYALQRDWDRKCWALYVGGWDTVYPASTAPLAICRAALAWRRNA